jgi:hypothetical protein
MEKMILILEDYQLKLLKTILNNEISLRKFGEYHPKDTEEVKKLLKIVDSVINRKSIKYTNGKEL